MDIAHILRTDYSSFLVYYQVLLCPTPFFIFNFSITKINTLTKNTIKIDK